jgi:glycosyltransferase involved in cell wall biosynthesis
MIKVALMSMKEMEKRIGQGIPKYTLYLYKYEKLLEKTYNTLVSKVYLPYNKLLGDALSFELSSFFKRPNLKSFDIIHIPTGFFIFHNKPKNVKYVTTIHDTNPMIVSKSLKYKIKDKLWRYLAFRRGLKFNINIADAVIVNSTQTKEEVLRLGTKKKVYVINLGVDKKFLTPKKFEKKRMNKKFYIGYVGSFATNKNIDFILDTANIINDESIEFHLWGAKTYTYEELIKKAGSNVKFRGFAPEKKIVKIYDTFDVFIFPSLYEGFGLPIMEAQARGLPVIIYKHGKIPKEVRKYCFEAEDPEHAVEIIENLKEKGYNEKERKKAMKYARSFTWEKTARETLKVYNEVIK